MRRLAPFLLLVLAGCRDEDVAAPAAQPAGECAPCAKNADCTGSQRCHRQACIPRSTTPADAGGACQCEAECRAPLACCASTCDTECGDGPAPADAGPDTSDRGEVGRTDPVDDPWPPPEGCELSRPYGFVSMITGRTRVVDLCSCDRWGDGGLEQVLNLVHGGTFVTHGSGVDAPRREVWVGNQLLNAVQRMRLAADLGSWEVLAQIDVPVNMSTIQISPNRRLVGVAPAMPGMVPNQPASRGEDRAIFIDTGLSRIVGIVEADSPAAVHFSPDSKTAYVPNINHRNFVVIDLQTYEVAQKVTLPWPDGKEGLGPSPFGELSLDGRWLAMPGLDSHRLWVYDVESGMEDFWFVDAPGEMPHMAAFHPTKPELWFSTLGRWPDPNNEAANPSIPSWVWVVDTETHETKDRFRWEPNGEPTVIAHIEITPDANMAWGSGSYASIVGFDLETHEVRCSVNLEGNAMPAMVLDTGPSVLPLP